MRHSDCDAGPRDDSAEREASEVGRRVEIGHMGLQRRSCDIAGRWDVLQDRGKQWSQICTVGHVAVAGPVSDARPALAEAYTTGKSRASLLSSSSRSTNSSYVSSTTSAIRASCRSTLLITTTMGSLFASALRSTKRVWGSGPQRHPPAAGHHRPSPGHAQPRRRNRRAPACR